MLKRLKSIDAFTKNILIVFAGTSLVNFLSLLYQLLIAHKLPISDFAAFNSLLSMFMLFSAPLVTLQPAVAKYCAEFNAHNQLSKVKFLLSDLLKKTAILAFLAFFIFLFISNYAAGLLRIPPVPSAYLLAGMLALALVNPVIGGGAQGLEFFGWTTSASIVSGVLKLGLAFIFIVLGFGISGALGAFLISTLTVLGILCWPLRKFIALRPQKEDIRYKEIFTYLVPLGINSFCYIALTSFDMVLVKYYFTSTESGFYALAQMVGKICLFLPGSIAFVMFPRTSGLNAKKLDTAATLWKAMRYCLGLCFLAVLFYNIFPSQVLMVLTGKVFPESILLGRFFSVSMSLFALSSILGSYFLSIKDLRFIKFWVVFTIVQNAAIIIWHKSLLQVQAILCMSAVCMFLALMLLAHKKKT